MPDQIDMGLKIDITIKAKKEKGSDKGFEQSQPQIEPLDTPVRVNPRKARYATRKQKRKEKERQRARGLSPFGEVDDKWWPAADSNTSLARRADANRNVNRQMRDKKSNAPHINIDVFKELQREVKEGKEALAKIKNQIGDGKTTLGSVSSFLKNPESGITKMLPRIFTKAGPHGLIAGAIVSMILASAKFVEDGVDLLSQKGLPLNRDWILQFENKVRAMLSEEDIKARTLGLDPYVTGAPGVYITGEGYGVRSSLEERDEIRALNQGQDAKARGISNV